MPGTISTGWTEPKEPIDPKRDHRIEFGCYSIGISPIVRLIERQKMLPVGTRRFPRWMAILLLYLVMIGALTGVGFMIFPPLVDQARQLWSAVPDMLERGQAFLISKGLLRGPIEWREIVQRAPVSGGSGAVGTVFGAVIGVLGGLFGLVTILILAFYFLIDADTIVNTTVRLFPRDRRRRAAQAFRNVTSRVSAWLAGQLFLAAIIGGSAAIALWLMGVPYFYVLALIAALGELIPIIGPLLAALPAIAVAFSVSPALALGVALFFLAQQQFENHVLVPKVMERQVGVSALGVIIALLIGGSLLGVVGAILAVPTAAIVHVLIEEIWPDAVEG